MKAKLKKTARKRRKFILTIGEDGGILVYIEGKRVLRRMYAPSPSEEDMKHFVSLFQSDPEARIYLLADTMDQTYVQQTLPPVSSLNIHKLIKRRLDRDFEENDLKGALQLGRRKEGRKDWDYLFIAAANAPPLSDWVATVLSLPNPFMGVYLLPVEAQPIILKLRDLMLAGSQAKQKKPFFTLTKNTSSNGDAQKRDKALWHIFISHNKVGGFRQIVLKGGKIIFTRLAQPIGEARADVIAGNIEQELSNTLEYLKRLSFNPSQGLEISVIVSREIREHLNLAHAEAQQVHIATPHEASKKLGIANATEEEDHFGDVLLSAAFALQTSPVLKFVTPDIETISQYYQYQQLARWAVMLVVPLCGLSTIYLGFEIVQLHGDVSFAEDNQKDAQKRLMQLQQEAEALPEDIHRITDMITIYERLQAMQYKPLPMVSRFSETLDEQTIVRQFDWSVSSQLPNSKSQEDGPPVQAAFVVDFMDNTGSVDQFLSRTEGFYNKLKIKFPAYEVNFSDLPSEFKGQDDTLDINFSEGGLNRQLQSRNITIRYTLTGPSDQKEAIGRAR